MVEFRKDKRLDVCLGLTANCTTGQHHPAASRAKAGQVAKDHEVTADACIQVLSELSAQFPAIITTCVSADMAGSPQCRTGVSQSVGRAEMRAADHANRRLFRDYVFAEHSLRSMQ